MNVTEIEEIVGIVRRVEFWPEAARIILARRILQTLERPRTSQLPPVPRGPTAAEIAGWFKTDKPAPDDATVKGWIDQYRMEKYGK
ncbi:MAG: hypothetical protein HUU20_26740 [Pirellulales bacterium]|nr:hypothetical protein [Pirellulales bacterium]